MLRTLWKSYHKNFEVLQQPRPHLDNSDIIWSDMVRNKFKLFQLVKLTTLPVLFRFLEGDLLLFGELDCERVLDRPCLLFGSNLSLFVINEVSIGALSSTFRASSTFMLTSVSFAIFYVQILDLGQQKKNLFTNNSYLWNR